MLKGSAFPYEFGLNKQLAGMFKEIRGIRVFEEVSLTLTFRDDSTKNEIFVAGEDIELPSSVKSITINSGLISMTRKTLA